MSKPKINGISQEFSDNINDPKTGICFQCRVHKNIDRFGKADNKYICNSCWDEFHNLIKNSGISFIEIPGRITHNMAGDRNEITDVFGIIGCDIQLGERFHLGGYAQTKSESEVAHAKSNMLSRQKQFISSNGGFVILWSHSDKKTPEQFIDWVKEIKDNFGSNYDVNLQRSGSNYWEFSGNLERISCAFRFRIFTETQFDSIANKLNDPYFKNVTILKDYKE